jgi:molybdate transport system substrate-binding protein
MLALACRNSPTEVTVGAAISLKEVMDELVASDPGSKSHITMVYGASGDLAAQMEHGAPFDVLASAGEEPLLAELADERCTLARNTLVLVKRRSAPEITWSTLAATGPTFRLAIGLTPQVPAGVYAEQALKNLGSWDALASKTVRGTNVRNVLDLVARGEADAGIVYATDAHIRADIDILGEVPSAARPDVRYPVYVSRRASVAGRAVADRLCGDWPKPSLASHGFLVQP